MPADDPQGPQQEKDKAELVIEIGEDFTVRMKVSGTPEKVAQLTREIDLPNLAGDLMDETERRANRRRFFSMAHRTVSVVTVLAIAGMVADFLNLWKLNTGWLVGLGAWVVGSVIYLYFAIVRDIFGLKVTVPPPPK